MNTKNDANQEKIKDLITAGATVFLVGEKALESRAISLLTKLDVSENAQHLNDSSFAMA